MSRFSRKTVIAAVALLERYGHSDITRFILEHALEDAGADEGASKRDRTNSLIRFLLKSPDRETEDGANLTDAIITDLVSRAARPFSDTLVALDPFDERHPELNRALKRDGFEIVGGTLRRSLPEALDLPAADDEVHGLLDRFGFNVPKGTSIRRSRIIRVENGRQQTVRSAPSSSRCSTRSPRALLHRGPRCHHPSTRGGAS